jgi:hypothetical protein
VLQVGHLRCSGFTSNLLRSHTVHTYKTLSSAVWVMIFQSVSITLPACYFAHQPYQAHASSGWWNLSNLGRVIDMSYNTLICLATTGTFGFRASMSMSVDMANPAKMKLNAPS